MLNSEAKSDIERIRGVLIRRSILGMIFMAVLTLSTLQYASYVSHERQRAAQRVADEAEEARKGGGDGKTDHSPSAEAAEILTAN